MAYKALYRTYRPQKFSEVIGQDHIVKTLQNALASGKISHAYLFSGPRGTGKTSVARIFAKALNCDKAPTSEPCGECVSCKEISDSNNPDVVEIDAASNNGVDEIREIRDKVKFLPGGSKYKVYIIDEVHMLSQGAFNALLKTLEEPPKHVIFILATTEPHKVLPTIISRCQRFDFKTLSVKEIAEQVEKVAINENFIISKEAIIGIAEGAEGGMRDALSYLDQAASFTDDEITIDDVNNVTGNLNYDKIIELARYFEEKNINNALKTINDLVIMGKEINKIVSGILQFYRDVLLYKNIDTTMFSKYIFEKEEFKILCEKLAPEKIFYYVDVLSDVQTKIKTSSTPNIYLEVAVIKMINLSEDDFNYKQRIEKVEEKINNITNSSDINDPVDNEKINILETKLSRVVNELSKLELHKLVERVTILEEKPTESNNLNEDKEHSTFNQNELNNLQNQINEIKNILLTNKQSNNTEDIAEKDDTLNNRLNDIEEKLEKLETNHSENKEDKTNNLLFDINLIKEKIENIEEKVYKLMSTSLAKNDNPISKKTKPRVSEGQIVLFGDEIVSIKDIDKPNVERFDFDDKQKDVLNLKTDNINEVDREEYNEEEIDASFSDNSEKEQFDFQEITVDDLEKHNVKEEKVLIKPHEIYDEIKVSDIEIDEPKKPTKIKTNDAEIIENSNSQLVRKINQEQETSALLNSLKIVKNESLETAPKVEKASEGEGEPQNKFVFTKDYINDDFSNYSVSVIERILHNSRTSQAREDKSRLVNLWKSIDKSAPRDKFEIADLLQEGQIVAVGEKEFILSYPNSSLCNQVMKIRFKRESLKLLFDLLGETYNYIALPEQIWSEKRIEYINQYNIGVRYPKLTPIDDPSLNVEKENQEFINSQEKMVNKAIKLFGENIVKIE